MMLKWFDLLTHVKLKLVILVVVKFRRIFVREENAHIYFSISNFKKIFKRKSKEEESNGKSDSIERAELFGDKDGLIELY